MYPARIGQPDRHEHDRQADHRDQPQADGGERTMRVVGWGWGRHATALAPLRDAATVQGGWAGPGGRDPGLDPGELPALFGHAPFGAPPHRKRALYGTDVVG